MSPPNAVLNFFPPKPSKLVEKANDSVTDKSSFPPKPTKSVEKSGVSPEKLVMQLVFTKFGLSPVIKMPSTKLSLSLSPAKPYTTLHSSFPFPLSKQKPPTSHQQTDMKRNNGAPTDRKHCRCKQSGCLKLYCECFAAGGYCDGCNCNCCRNNVENEGLRKAAMESILQRNPNAFRPKIPTSPSNAQDNVDDAKDNSMVGKHNWGCRCKKTGCLKNYCECFHAKVSCSKNCKCMDCKNSEEHQEKVALPGRDYNSTKIFNNYEGYKKSVAVAGGGNTNTNISKNFEGSKEREAITNADHGEPNICKNFEGHKEAMACPRRVNNQASICIKQANAAASAAIGFSDSSIIQASRKRKLQEFLDLNEKDAPIQKLKNHQKVNPLRVYSSLSALSVGPVGNVGNASILNPKEFQCSARSSFAEQDVEQLCSLLVLASEAAKKVLDKNGNQAVRKIQTANTSEVQDSKIFEEEPNVQKETLDDHLSETEADATNTGSHISGGNEGKEGRLSSPGAIALRSNGKDELITGATKQDQILIHGCNGDVYLEQERLVLASFRDCLKKIIVLGNKKGQFCDVGNSIVRDGTST